MEETLVRVWGDLVGRVGGPLTLRLVIQPTVATLLALRAGLNDSRRGRTPYFWNILLNLDQRKDLLREGWKDVGKLFIMAVVLDTVYQLIVARWVYPFETLIVAVVLAFVPYVLVRGLASRLAQRRLRKSTRPTPDAGELR